MTFGDFVFLSAARALRGAANIAEAAGARRDLRRRASGLSVAAAYDLAIEYRFGNIRIHPVQIRSEILSLLDRLDELRPKTVLELGTARGGSLFLFTRVATEDAMLVSVDLAGGPFGGGYPRTHAPLLRSFARGEQVVELVRGDTHAPSTIDEVRRVLAGRPVDFLFVDADHTYDGVRADFKNYGRLVRSGGLVAFHDIVPGDPLRVGGVPRFWREIKARYPYEELVEDWSQRGYGIGVIRQP